MRLTLLLILTTSAGLFAQTEVYVNEWRETITKEEFDKEETESYFYLDYDSEELIVHVKAKRVLKDRLDSRTHQLLRKSLYERSGKELDRKTYLVIVYSPGMDKCLRTGNRSSIRASHRRLNAEIENLEATDIFYVYNKPEANNTYGKNINWIQDDPKTIQELFFPIHFPCGSFVLIDKKGNYYAFRGEYAVDQIIEGLQDPEITFSGGSD
ncbi:hypothetical protein [Gilvibacter sediminis]|uniref:hypothetical protein n=1 Tax=Gilvibacter sediminis TaxID=379071 RepID=UPI002350CC15|nr:hypothetical protein [Gilvibacter sediminis]MDC7996482.1 hypothetical protein [Gilvibacter sediminis]